MKTKHTTAKVTTGGRYPQEVEIPPGLRVKIVPPYPMQKAPEYFLDEFPEALFPKGSIILHDAEHYGVRLTASQVKPD